MTRLHSASLAQQDQWERRHQHANVAPTDVGHRQRGQAVAAQHRQRRRQQRVASDQEKAIHHGTMPWTAKATGTVTM